MRSVREHNIPDPISESVSRAFPGPGCGHDNNACKVLKAQAARMKEAWKAGRNGSANGNSKRNKTVSFAPRKEELNAMCAAAAAKAVKSALKRSKDESEDEAEAEELNYQPKRKPVLILLSLELLRSQSSNEDQCKQHYDY